MLNKSIVVVSVQLALVLATVAVPAGAAPRTISPNTTVCSSGPSAYPLGIDGGLTGLSRGEIVLGAPSVHAVRPHGVDGGLLSLLFARSQGTGVAANAGAACQGVFTARGG